MADSFETQAREIIDDLVDGEIYGNRALEDLITWHQAAVEQAVVAAKADELERAIEAYNFLQEEVEQPTAELKIGNHYILDRLTELKAQLKGTTKNER